MWFADAKMEAWAAKWHSCAKGGFHSSFRSCEMGFGLRNFRSALRGCLQMTITSSFQLQFAHRLKRWTPDFPRFEKRYSMHEMDSKKYSKCVQQLCHLEFFMLDFSLFPPCILDWLLAKDYKAPKFGLFL
ncbi:hypothetical protein VitviT2T_024631 [Vitis vinifera]|nr:hypothetical protein VitviT2T_024631 [Vitis vinifera]